MIYPVGEQLAEDLKQGGGELSQGDVHVDITTEEPKKRKAHRGKSYSPATSVKKIKTECHEPQGLGDTLLDRLERKVYPALVEDLRVKQEELDSSLARETELHSKLAASYRQLQGYRDMADELSEAMECSICLERPARFAFNPCGHCFCCHESCGSFQVRKCPECRVTKKGKLHLYGVFTSITSVLERLATVRTAEGAAEKEEGNAREKLHHGVRKRILESEVSRLQREMILYKDEAKLLEEKLVQAEAQVRTIRLQQETSLQAEVELRQQLGARTEEKIQREEELVETRKRLKEAKEEALKLTKETETLRSEHLAKVLEWEKESQDRRRLEEDRTRQEEDRKKQEEGRKRALGALVEELRKEVVEVLEEMGACQQELRSELETLTLNHTIKQKCVRWLNEELSAANKERDEAREQLVERDEAEKRFRALLEVACRAAERDKEHIREMEEAHDAIVRCTQDMEDRVEGLRVVVGDLDLFLPHYHAEGRRSDARGTGRRGEGSQLFLSADPRRLQEARRIDLSTYRKRMGTAAVQGGTGPSNFQRDT